MRAILWTLQQGAKFTTVLTKKTGVVLANPDPLDTRSVVVALEGEGSRSLHRQVCVEVETS